MCCTVCIAACVLTADIPRAFVTLNKHEPGVVVSINEGGRAEFECTALVNPKPMYHWTLQPENMLIPPYRAVFSANQRRVMVFDIMEKTCVRCLAVSSLGNATATRCVEVLSKAAAASWLLMMLNVMTPSIACSVHVHYRLGSRPVNAVFCGRNGTLPSMKILAP